MKKPTPTHRYPRKKNYLWQWVLLVLFVLFMLFVIFSDTSANKGYNPGFKKCQYPTRITNTEDTCDNTDPCDPADAVKGGSGECKPMSQNVNQYCTEQYIKMSGGGRCLDKTKKGDM